MFNRRRLHCAIPSLLIQAPANLTTIMSLFLNKVLSEHSHPHLFTYCPWLLLHHYDVAERL